MKGYGGVMGKILVISTENCGACIMTKKKLSDANIEFDYVVNSEMDETEWMKYRRMALANGKMSMPIIVRDGVLVDLSEVI